MSDGSGPRESAERDFGDSAGYGGGGSTRDYRDVLGEDAAPRPNPLDAVMTIPPQARRTGSRRSSARPERDPSADLVLAAGAMLVASLGLLAWRHTQERRTRRRRPDDGAVREALARQWA